MTSFSVNVSFFSSLTSPKTNQIRTIYAAYTKIIIIDFLSTAALGAILALKSVISFQILF